MPHQIGQAGYLPTLDVHAIGKERLALTLVGWPLKIGGKVSRQMLALGSQAVPAFLLVIYKLRWKVGCHDVAAQANGDPVLTVNGKSIDGCVVDLIGLRLARSRKQARNLLRRIVFLCNYQYHVNPLVSVASMAAAWCGAAGFVF